MSAKNYAYIKVNLLSNPNNYFYSKFEGLDFLENWRESRENAIMGNTEDCEPDIQLLEQSNCNIDQYFLGIFNGPSDLQHLGSHKREFDLLLRNFEAKKKIFCNYQTDFISKGQTNFLHVKHYVFFARALLKFHKVYKSLTYINALLKCTDILISHRDGVPNKLISHFNLIIKEELAIINSLISKFEIKIEQ